MISSLLLSSWLFISSTFTNFAVTRFYKLARICKILFIVELDYFGYELMVLDARKTGSGLSLFSCVQKVIIFTPEAT